MYFNAPLCNFNLQSATSYHIHYHTSAVFFIWIQRTTFIKWLIPDWVTTLWRVRINNVGIILKKSWGREDGALRQPAGVSLVVLCVCVCACVCVPSRGCLGVTAPITPESWVSHCQAASGVRSEDGPCDGEWRHTLELCMTDLTWYRTMTSIVVSC